MPSSVGSVNRSHGPSIFVHEICSDFCQDAASNEVSSSNLVRRSLLIQCQDGNLHETSHLSVVENPRTVSKHLASFVVFVQEPREKVLGRAKARSILIIQASMRVKVNLVTHIVSFRETERNKQGPPYEQVYPEMP